MGRKPEGKRPLGRSRRRSENNIKIDFQEVGWKYGLHDLARDRDRRTAFENAAMSLQLP